MNPMLLNGPLLFARYAFMPNRLGFCGGQNERGLFEACTVNHATPDLNDWARQFEGAYPYLALIAQTNGLRDPLDHRVVEAYWIGNELLEGVSLAPLYTSLHDRFASRLSPKTLGLILGKVPVGARPHHSFHVLDVCRRTGALAESLEVLDNCRISWGQVQAIVNTHLEVSVPALVFQEGRLALGTPEKRFVRHQMDGRGFVDDICPGDWVSIHWGWACDKLTIRQVANLRRYTLQHVAIANETL